MGELEYDAEEEFVEPAADLTEWRDADAVPSSSNLAPGAVSSRFFDERGEPRQVPELRTEAGFLAFYEGVGREQEAAEALRGPDASQTFDQGPSSEQEAYGDWMAQTSAAQAHNAAVFEAEILSRVTEAAREANVRDEQALQQVAADALQSIAEWSQHQLALGASGRQVWSMMSEPSFGAWLDERIGEGLQQAAFDERMANTGTRRWLLRNMEQQRIGFELGTQGPPQTPYERHPGLAKMAAAMAGYAQRQAERDAAMAAIKARSRSYSGPRNPPQVFRKTINR
jgi:hypothetical protein